jgi:hypothetical protein
MEAAVWRVVRRTLVLAADVAVLGALFPTLMMLVIIAVDPLWTPSSCAVPCDGPVLVGLVPWSAVVVLGWAAYLVHSIRRRTTPVAAFFAWAGRRIWSGKASS